MIWNSSAFKKTMFFDVSKKKLWFPRILRGPSLASKRQVSSREPVAASPLWGGRARFPLETLIFFGFLIFRLINEYWITYQFQEVEHQRFLDSQAVPIREIRNANNRHFWTSSRPGSPLRGGGELVVTWEQTETAIVLEYYHNQNNCIITIEIRGSKGFPPKRIDS